MLLDRAILKRECEKRGYRTWSAIAQGAGVDTSTVTRSLGRDATPSIHLLGFLVRLGVDIRKVWVQA